MSLINQMLVDLEQRRASSNERGQLPDHVRALPQKHTHPRAPWILGIGAVIVGAIATGVGVSDLPAQVHRLVMDKTRGQTPPAIIAAAAPVAVNDVRPAEAPLSELPADELRPAARLTLELSAAPASPGTPAESKPAGDTARPITAIPSSQVLAKAPETAPVPGRPVPVEEKPTAAQSREALAPPVSKAPAPPRPADDARQATVSARPAKATPVVAPPAEIDKQVRKMNPQQQAEAEYAKGTGLMHQGRNAEARESFESALRVHPGHHSARQALAGLLIEAKRNSDAERVFQDGLTLSPSQTGFAMALARLQVERGDNQGGIETLQHSLGHAGASPDYLAFLGALLQRQQRHGEAVEQFQAALRQKPQSGVWLMGMGISLQALNRTSEAQDAFRRAQTAGTLTPELRAFVDQRLRQLQ
jgi:MSHA biogenesis protein MshN